MEEGGRQQHEYLEDLVDLRVPGKQRALGHHLRQDRAYGPHVHGEPVGLAAEKDLWSSVPESNHLWSCKQMSMQKQHHEEVGWLAHLVGEWANGRHERPRRAEVGDLETAIPRNEDVLRLEIAATRSGREVKVRE